jgi:hypothetical protein
MTLYEQDYCLWIEKTLDLLREKKLQELDLDRLIEEIEDMGNSQKDALESNLTVLLQHLLKWQYQLSHRSNSWKYTIAEHRRRLAKAFKKSPSLKRYFSEVFEESYLDARKLAAAETGLSLETFPISCPFQISDVLDEQFLPPGLNFD